MKKGLFLTVGTLLLLSLSFSSCEKDDKNTEEQKSEEQSDITGDAADNAAKDSLNGGKDSDEYSVFVAPGKLKPEIEAKLATKTFTYKDVSFKMVYVEGGSFLMGAQPFDRDKIGYDSSATHWEAPVHKVTLSSYAIGETEVTQELWSKIGIKTSIDIALRQDLVGDNKPIGFMSYDKALDFITLLNSKMHRSGDLDEDLMFALPTEAQWEFAARGGVKSKGYYFSGSNTFEDVAELNSVFKDVKAFMPNELGIYGMTGNALELVRDYWSAEANGYAVTDEFDPINDVYSDRVVYRGGCPMYYYKERFRNTYRMMVPHNVGSYYMSFRLALVPVTE